MSDLANKMPEKTINGASFIFKHTIVTRIMHGLHLIAMIVLILTGFYIYAPTVFRIFPNMDSARYIHFIFMYIIIWTMVYKIYYSLVTGEIKELIFRWQDLLELPNLFKYYLYGIFTGAPKKDYGKYNPGQRLIYSLWPVLLIAQTVTGIAMYFTARWARFNNIFGGLQNIKLIHFVICWIFTITVVAHIYLGSTGPKIMDFYKSVITGWEKQTTKRNS